MKVSKMARLRTPRKVFWVQSTRIRVNIIPRKWRGMSLGIFGPFIPSMGDGGSSMFSAVNLLKNAHSARE